MKIEKFYGFLVLILVILSFNIYVYAQSSNNIYYTEYVDTSNVNYDSSIDPMTIKEVEIYKAMHKDDYQKYQWYTPHQIYSEPNIIDKVFNADKINNRFYERYNDNFIEKARLNNSNWEYRIYGNTATPDSIDYYRTNNNATIESEILRVYPSDNSKFKYQYKNYNYDLHIKEKHKEDHFTRDMYNISTGSRKTINENYIR